MSASERRRARQWPTPSATDPDGSRTVPAGTTPTGQTRDGRKKQIGLPEMVRQVERGLWPTPKSSPSGPDFARADRPASGGDDLATAVAREMLPTPTASDADRTTTYYPRGNETLNGAARRLPTPTASMRTEQDMAQAMFEGGDPRRPAYGEAQLRSVESPQAEFRTPSSRDWKGMSAKSWRERPTGDPTPTLPDQIGGQLNPRWVEWLMGYPDGWTDLEGSEMPSSRKSSSKSRGRTQRSSG